MLELADSSEIGTRARNVPTHLRVPERPVSMWVPPVHKSGKCPTRGGGGTLEVVDGHGVD
jgi:hypothetical protein